MKKPAKEAEEKSRNSSVSELSLTDKEKRQLEADYASNVHLQMYEFGLLNPCPPISRAERRNRQYESNLAMIRKENRSADGIREMVKWEWLTPEQAEYIIANREKVLAVTLEPWEIEPENYYFKGKIIPGRKITQEELDMPMEKYPLPEELKLTVQQRREKKMLKLGLEAIDPRPESDRIN